jgi:2'-5' RNA ligase
VRLFTAFALPSGVAESLAAAARSLAGPAPAGAAAAPRIRWSRPEDMHITLVFLGEVAETRLPQIHATLGTLAASPCSIAIQQPGYFRGSGALVASVAPRPALLALAEAVTRVLEPCGFSAEPRPYRPHITLARLRGAYRLRLDSVPWPQADFRAGSFHLYRSHLGPGGARYEIVYSYKWAGECAIG